MGLEHKVKTHNLLDDIEEELFKSLKLKISFDRNDKEPYNDEKSEDKKES